MKALILALAITVNALASYHQCDQELNGRQFILAHYEGVTNVIKVREFTYFVTDQHDQFWVYTIKRSGMNGQFVYEVDVVRQIFA